MMMKEERTQTKIAKNRMKMEALGSSKTQPKAKGKKPEKGPKKEEL